MVHTPNMPIRLAKESCRQLSGTVAGPVEGGLAFILLQQMAKTYFGVRPSIRHPPKKETVGTRPFRSRPHWPTTPAQWPPHVGWEGAWRGLGSGGMLGGTRSQTAQACSCFPFPSSRAPNFVNQKGPTCLVNLWGAEHGAQPQTAAKSTCKRSKLQGGALSGNFPVLTGILHKLRTAPEVVN